MTFMRLFGFAVLAILIGANLSAEIAATLLASDESPVPVGTVVTFEAVPADNAGTLTFRFSIRNPGEDFHLVRDFSRIRTLNWAALDEGTYEIQVTIRDSKTGEIGVVSGSFGLTSRLVSPAAAVADTHHPLIFLYSAPACPEGSTIHVVFRPEQGGTTTSIPPRPCLAGGSMNFWLAGLKKSTSYLAQHVVNDVPSRREVKFTTGDEIPLPFFPQNATIGPSQETAYPYVMHSALSERPSATDLDGNLVWYYPDLLTSLTRVEEGGRMWGFVQDLSGPPEEQVLREFDVAGIMLRETDAAVINEQLKARGLNTITGFHHEARSLPDGKVLVLASSERILTNVQGNGEVDVIGDTILVLDANMQVEWVWDSFDHLDTSRMSTLTHLCRPAAGGCPPFSLRPIANDWTHGNAIALTPDGNLLFSARHMDWLIKIDYANGQGSGHVIWRLGKDGDFTAASDDLSPWFSHQHDGSILEDGRLLVFDNGNYRWDTDRTTTSRGQVWRLDEEKRTATLEMNADLGVYASALGSAQALENGYHFEMGTTTSRVSRAVETNAAGKITYTLESPSMIYRTFRLRNLYTKP